MRLVDIDDIRIMKFLSEEDDPSESDGEREYRNGWNDALTAINDIQPSVEPEPHWIPVTERLPFAEYGESANVFATCRNREQESPDEYRWVRILYFNGGNWCYPTGETYEQQVIAWMPLPEPWKGEQNA